MKEDHIEKNVILTKIIGRESGPASDSIKLHQGGSNVQALSILMDSVAVNDGRIWSEIKQIPIISPVNPKETWWTLNLLICVFTVD